MRVKGLQGTIFPRESGLYFYNIRINKKRHKAALRTRDKNTAIKRAFIEEGKVLGDGSAAADMYLHDYLDQYRAHTLKRKNPKTLKNEDYMLAIIKAIIPDRPLANYPPKYADEFFDALQVRVRKDHRGNEIPNRITNHGKNMYLRFLRAIWNQAITWKFIDRDDNPWKAVDKFTTESKLPRTLEREELQNIFASMGKLYPEISDLITFLLYTGMRRSEALTLRWEDVRWAKGKEHILLKPKNTKFNKARIVPLLEVPLEILERRKELPAPFSDALTPKWISTQFRHILNDAGVPDAKLHDLRKTFATILASEHVSSFTIQKWLGHSSGDVTGMFYIGLDQKTRERVNGVVNGMQASITKMPLPIQPSAVETSGPKSGPDRDQVAH